MTTNAMRNLAIIAHVDHGKTTLVDGLLQQAGVFRANQKVIERVMDSHDLERERGITIHSKNTSIEFDGVRIQLVDTPGHADFGGEVERVLGMVDSVLLLVDAVEGVMPQTRFVLGKAIARGLRPIVVVNKIDRPEQRAHEVLDEVFELLLELGASDEALDFPVIYASAKEGWASTDAEKRGENLLPLLNLILDKAPAPDVDVEGPLQFQAVTLSYDEYVGRLVIGRMERGRLFRGSTVLRLGADGVQDTFRVTKLFTARGLERVECEEAEAGQIVIIAGNDSIEIGDTICPLGKPDPLPRIKIDPPTLSVTFSVNDSPFAGQEGKYLTSRQIGDRLQREALGNVSIQVGQGATAESFLVSGRGELQIGVLIETMRREGYEFSVSRPKIILREVEGVRCEPVEEVVIEGPEDIAGIVMDALASRKGRLESMEPRDGRVILNYRVPSRGLFGYRNDFLSATRGEGIMHRTVAGYEPHAGDLPTRSLGSIVSSDQGKTTAYSLWHIQERATMFVTSGVQVYEGQVVGENRRSDDMNVNVTRPKKLTNVRASGKDDAAVLTPPRRTEIEPALGWIAEDELLEVTPVSLRLRKRILASNLRKRTS